MTKTMTNTRNIKLRPHHLLCTQGYSSKGYSPDFVSNMTAVTSRLRGDGDISIDIVFSTDDICAKCPKMLGTDLCEDNEKVKSIDRKVIERFGIEEKAYNYRDITREIKAKMTATIMDDICKDCSWYPVSDCKRNVVGHIREAEMRNGTPLEDAIITRRSRRKYLGTPIEPSVSEKLRELAAEYSRAANLRIEFVLNNGKAFNGFTKSYGMFSGVNDYIGLISDKNDPHNNERIGYYGELLMLHATAMGLGTCWVGGTYRRTLCPFQMTDSESLVCSITIGNVAESLSFKERFVSRITHRKTKTAEEMFEADAPVPEWFISAMAAVQKAPSAVNRQPVMFSYKNGVVRASVKDIADPMLAIDFGIAKLHFEIGAGGGKWSWGNNGEFIRG